MCSVGTGFRPRGKREDLLRLAVLVDGEIVGAEIGDELAFLPRNRDADIDEIDAPSECGGLWLELRRRGNDRHRDRGGDRENTGRADRSPASRVGPHLPLRMIRRLMHVRTRRRMLHRACRSLTQPAFALRASAVQAEAARHSRIRTCARWSRATGHDMS